MLMKNKSIPGSALCLLLLLTTLLAASISDIHADSHQRQIYTITITGVITNGTTEYIERAIMDAEEDGAEALIMYIDTPGGLVGSTLTIMELMLSANVPVVTYVSPQGAIAASAGSFILVSGHIAAMSPGTTVGAAMPVTISFSEEGGSSNPADEKTIKFLAGHIESISETRNRNGEVISQFVTDNLTLTPQEALDDKVIDLLADSPEALLQQIHGETVQLPDTSLVLNTKDAELIELPMTNQEKATSIISNPQVSFLLVIMGIYGLIIGFNAPQTYIPEVGGAIALMLGLYGLGTFEVNLFAVLMILLGILLLVAEVMTPTYGVLSTGGIISIVLGGMFLPREPLMPSRWFLGLRSLALGIGIGASVLMLIMLRGILKSRRRKATHSFDGLIATVIEAEGENILLKMQGEIWQGINENPQDLVPGQQVPIIQRDGLKLVIGPADESLPTD